MDTFSLWQAVLGELELSVSKANFTTWFKHTFVSEIQNNTLFIGVPNTFTKSWLESKYHPFILKAIQNITHGDITTVVFKVENQKQPPLGGGGTSYSPTINPKSIGGSHGSPQPRSPLSIPQQNQFGLNQKYTFESFVVGKNNELAYAAARAIAENPGTTYNPLFVYGGVGLGKTHLLQAVGNEIIKTTPEKKVLYTTCENFIRDYINSVRSNFRDNFVEKYRLLDVLMIDDIQFMAGKPESQEFFFNTFNTLHQQNKQIILSSDRRPSELPTFDDRLQSRLGWGLTADIHTPDIEMRTAILEFKAKEKNYPVSNEIIRYIASIMQHNIRELEGALTKVIAYHTLSHITPTIESVKEILAETQAKHRTSAITAKGILKIVSSYFDIPIEKITGQSRKKELVAPRQIVMYLMREEMKASFPNIGDEMGKRDHTTVMHAYNKISNAITKEEKTRQDIHLIRQKLYSDL